VEDRLTREERGLLAAVVAWFAITAAWWLLALWPLDNAPVWLERTRYVCFGVNHTGLPDGGGWIGLIAGPLGMLLILVVGWLGAFSSLVQKRAGFCIVGALALGVLLLAGGGAWRVANARASTNVLQATSSLPPATYPRLNLPMPALALASQTGEVLTADAARGRPMLVTFAYAHCATVCPVIVKQTLDAQRMLKNTPYHPMVVIVTLDPWRDTPSRLPALATSWQLPADAWVLSGSVAQVESVLNGWNIPRSRDASTGEVTHPSVVYVIDKDGRIAFASSGGSENIAALVRRI
jgi:protein SCO1